MNGKAFTDAGYDTRVSGDSRCDTSSTQRR